LRRLDVRLFASYALVVFVGAATFVVTFVLVAPRTFDDRIHSMHSMGGASESHDAFVSALGTSLPIAVLVSVGVAALVSAFVARRFLRPIDDVRRTTRRLAAGEYDQRVPEPVELELAALATDVNALAATLETTERRRAELVAEVAHEMRTPLTTIDGYVEGILDGVFEPSEETLTAIGEETARLKRLAADLGALSRADEGFDLHRSPVDLARLATDVAERLRPQFDDKGVALRVESTEPLVVEADRDRITQVLTNLLGNALTYTPTGGRVAVTPRPTIRGAGVEVTDTGVGIAPGDLERVFDRFYRVRGLSRPAGGSGIGLTIARSIARAHGGDIEATSEGPERGATFTLTLPTSELGAAAFRDP
jgi:histidine kinase